MSHDAPTGLEFFPPQCPIEQRSTTYYKDLMDFLFTSSAKFAVVIPDNYKLRYNACPKSKPEQLCQAVNRKNSVPTVAMA
uniref:Uncharacterized protein n=1 Tax=Heterorhabditis bacteriophora TaxID=37862 RepID=A0A1I7W7Y4_HETBA